MYAETGLMEDSLNDDCGQDIDVGRGMGPGVPRKRAHREGRHPRPQALVIDDQTMLSREEIIDYIHRQAELTRKRHLKQVATAVKTHIDNLLSRPHGGSDISSDLMAFWMTATTRTIGGGAEESRNLVVVEEMRYEGQNPLFSDIELEVGFMEEPLEPEIRRRQASGDIDGTPMGVGIDDFIDVGTEDPGRVKQSDCMPWSIDLRANIDSRSENSSTGSDHLRKDFETIFDPVTGRAVRHQRKASGTSRSSLELEDLEDQPFARRRGVQPGRSQSGSRSQEISRASSQQRAEGGGSDSSTDAQNLFMDIAVHTEGVQERLVIERETVHFLEYVRSILREANAKSFSFADVASIHRRRDVAASALYHVLSLSTMDRMRPTQALPYGDIHVELVE